MTRGSRVAFALVVGAALVAVPLAFAVRSASPEAEPRVRIERTGPRIRVEVLNAGGVSGLARDATEFLRDRGFDVVFFGNAESFDTDSTLVFDRVGRMKDARAVADALGIGNVVSQADSNRYVDVSVWLGSGWTPPAGSGDRFAGAPDRPWWDPRGWLGP